MSLYKLILDREIIDTKIRAVRVRQVRQTVMMKTNTGMPVTSKLKQAVAQLEEIDGLIERVHYQKNVVDDLLERTEDLLDIIDTFYEYSPGDRGTLETL